MGRGRDMTCMARERGREVEGSRERERVRKGNKGEERKGDMNYVVKI